MLRLRAEREALGLSRAKLARMAGLSDITYGKVEKGDVPPYPKYRAAIAAALEWDGDPMELFEEVEEIEAEEIKVIRMLSWLTEMKGGSDE